MRESDVVSIHLRLSDRTRGLITARHLALMKPTAYLVNTARGAIVDEAALVETLRAGRIAGAALDVFGTEPLPPAHPLLALDNVVLTPHTGFVTRETFDVFFEQTVASITEWLDGTTPARAPNPVPTP
jgi:phosphoglycerate dehydrogenase-like enzyme